MALEDFTSKRLQSFLEHKGLHFEVLEDGDILVGFENGLFFHSIRKQPRVWAIRSTWRGDIPESDIEQARHAVNTWNQDAPFPKLFLSKDDDEDVWQINGEIHFVADEGLSDDQLAFNHSVALSTSFEMFEYFEQEFPHLVTWTEED